MRRLTAFAVGAGLAALLGAPPASAAESGQARCGKRDRAGYVWIFDGSRRCYARWRHAGGARVGLRSGTLRTRPGGSGLGVLWYAARRYGDFSMRLQFRDDSPVADRRANSGVHVRFPAPRPPVPGCPTTANGVPQPGDAAAWIAINCGHEIQINDSPEVPGDDPRKTGSIYGFADVNLARARPRAPGVWNNLEIRVVGQRYTVIRNGAVINRYVNRPGVPVPDRPLDPDSSSRGRVGHVGLQAHGGPQDVVSFRRIRVRDLSDD